MEKGDRWKAILRKTIAYTLVATLSSAMTLFLCSRTHSGQSPKLMQLRAYIDEMFIGEVDDGTVEDMMAAGMVAALGDQWSYYIPASQFQAYENNHTNSYVGIGVTVEYLENDAGVLVKKVDPNGSAKEGGILPGDVIVAVNGKNVNEIGSQKMVDMISGDEGTNVEITVKREAEELSFSLTRRKLLTVVATGKMLTETIGYIRINNFSDRCAEETIAAFEDLEAQGAKAMIFDVRFNPGGYVHEMVEVLDYLLPEGVLFRSEDYNGITEEQTSDAACKNIPMAVLINYESVSAAEFFAAALDEYDYAETVGQKTLGKGYFQKSFVLIDGSAVNLSVGKYYTPNGVSLAEAGGLQPDHPVEIDEETMALIASESLEAEKDAQLQKAMEILQEALK